MKRALVLLVVTSACAVPPPAKPLLPLQFTADLIARVEGTSDNITGKYYYDAAKKLNYYSEHIDSPILPTPIVAGIYYTPTQSFYASEGLCKSTGGHFTPTFDVLYASTTVYNGTTTVHGIKCDLWVYRSAAINYTFCTHLETIVLYEVAYSINGLNSDSALIFANFTPRVSDPSVFTPPAACFQPPPVCNGTDTQHADMDVYIFQPPHQVGNIADQDVGDLRGDTSFVCFDYFANNTAHDGYAWITQYTVRMATTWGMYRECNGYPPLCIGDTVVNVGREAALGNGYLKGQCENNTQFGSWFSLPSVGQCQAGDTISIANNCTWQLLKTVKTIDGQCLVNKPGFAQACRALGSGGSITKPEAIFQQAFASDDPSNGGCPPISTEPIEQLAMKREAAPSAC
eukprot:TRINITY_DN7864_c0_g1_i1.p1 TRINITY_DN7864_c0_g1~~TRINITY_DN7864_c0_g1_i1.p1  ORF type:complete len:401 (+),score=68.60 TRINITY_DN7864_c0_g1_i1:1554-2756(+)